MMKKTRLRFAPSPTGALHIGGIRTALYNYLLAKKTGGTFILRIEDTDQTRYVPGAEEYIIESLKWCGLIPDEGLGFGGTMGPYRQSERKAMYGSYAQQLLAAGHAYYAFDTPEELEAQRVAGETNGNTFKYDAVTRMKLNNSLTLAPEEVNRLISGGVPWVIRLKVPESEVIIVQDLVRGEVQFHTSELDDKVMLKADGMPTYHLANVVDDHLMEITHVVRGEEWLPSTAHHVLLYRSFGWLGSMPCFAHLPLILRPDGKGKLSKRDGAKFGMPVFPLSWQAETPEDSFVGFRETGFDPRALLNFLAFLGWSPGTEQEIFTMEELIDIFSIDKIGKSGARFDFEKVKWFNKQYIMATDDETLAGIVGPILAAQGHQPDHAFLLGFCAMMKERVTFYGDFWKEGYYFFEPVKDFDEKTIAKKWDDSSMALFTGLMGELNQMVDHEWNAGTIQHCVEQFVEKKGLKFGDVLPILRIGLAGTMKGPAIFEMMALLGKTTSLGRLDQAFLRFDSLVSSEK